MTPLPIALQRKLLQWLSTLLLLLIPFVQVGGDSLLRLDAPSRTLLFFGASLRIEEFSLLLLVILIMVFTFLFITMVFGRVWCGWLCPQTTLSDLSEYLLSRIKRLIPSKPLAMAATQLLFLLLSFLVAANLIWYFIPPPEFFQRLSQGGLGMVAGISLGATMLLVYLDLAFVRRLFCSTVCPYGRIQLMTTDRNTLVLEFDPLRAGDCINCGSCTQVCPTGIDIKNGLQIECINCGRCLDACRGVMEKLGKTGLIHYTFGSRETGGGHPLNTRSLLLGGVVIALCAALAAGIMTRKEATLKIRRNDAVQVQRLADGRLINFFTVYIENRSRQGAIYNLKLAGTEGRTAELLGPVSSISLAANDNRRIDLVLRFSPKPGSSAHFQLLLMRGATTVAAVPLQILEE